MKRKGVAGRNVMLFDVQLADADMEDAHAVHAKIQQVEDEFDFVLLADR